MRYIKKYNEGNSEVLDEQEVKDFCEMNAAYLLDDGLEVLVSPEYFDLQVRGAVKTLSYCKVTLSFRLFVNKSWGQIKDAVIPFLTRLRNEYDLLEFYGRRGEDIRVEIYPRHSDSISHLDWFNINDMISENIVPAGRLRDDHKVCTIQFKIKGKK